MAVGRKRKITINNSPVIPRGFGQADNPGLETAREGETRREQPEQQATTRRIATRETQDNNIPTPGGPPCILDGLGRSGESLKAEVGGGGWMAGPEEHCRQALAGRERKGPGHGHARDVTKKKVVRGLVCGTLSGNNSAERTRTQETALKTGH